MFGVIGAAVIEMMAGPARNRIVPGKLRIKKQLLAKFGPVVIDRNVLGQWTQRLRGIFAGFRRPRRDGECPSSQPPGQANARGDSEHGNT
jgi:hypothetical protein